MKKHLLPFIAFFLTLSAYSQANMPDEKGFTSSRNFFKLEYPNEWDMFENPNGTYHFERPVQGTGKFEITESRNYSDSGEIVRFLEDESFNHPDAKYIYNDSKTTLSYTNLILVEGKETMAFVWVIANRNTVLVCRYMVDNKLKNEQRAQVELISVNNIIQTVTFLP